MNTLYDLPGEILRGRKELLRLRQYGSEWTLTHKSKSRLDVTAAARNWNLVGDGKQMEFNLGALFLGYTPSFGMKSFAPNGRWKGAVVVDETRLETLRD